MRIAHVALWTHDLDGRRNSNAKPSAASIGEGTQ